MAVIVNFPLNPDQEQQTGKATGAHPLDMRNAPSVVQHHGTTPGTPAAIR